MRDSVDKQIIEQPVRKLIGHVAFSFVLLALLWRWWSEVLLHQLNAPVLKYAYVDPGYWLAFLMRLPQTLTSHFWLSLVFDLLLIISAIVALVGFKQRIAAALYTVCIALYVLCFNAYGMHHTHCLIGMLFIGVPFLASRDRTFTFLWNGLRYFTLWIYGSAFLWKLCRGVLWYPQQALADLMENNAAYLAYNPDSILAQFLWWCIDHPTLLTILFVFAILGEGLFIIGFFTKKFDWLLFALSILFHIATFLTMDVVFFELWMLSLTFLPWQTLYQRFLQKQE